MIAHQNAWCRSQVEFGKSFDDLRFRHVVDCAPEGKLRSGEMSFAMTAIPRTVTIEDTNVVHEAPMLDRKDPIAHGHTRVLQRGSSTLYNVADLSLAPGIVLVSARDRLSVADGHLAD